MLKILVKLTNVSAAQVINNKAILHGKSGSCCAGADYFVREQLVQIVKRSCFPSSFGCFGDQYVGGCRLVGFGSFGCCFSQLLYLFNFECDLFWGRSFWLNFYHSLGVALNLNLLDAQLGSVFEVKPKFRVTNSGLSNKAEISFFFCHRCDALSEAEAQVVFLNEGLTELPSTNCEMVDSHY